MTKALIIVDYSKDFVASDGALTAGDPAQAIDSYIAELFETFIEDDQFVVIANDLHEEGDRFHPETKLFPPHNLLDSSGRDIYGLTGKTYNKYQAYPNVFYTDKRRYSAFVGTEVNLRLRERRIAEVWIVGVVTNICILHTAISAYNLGYQITIPVKGVTSFDIDAHDWALDHLKSHLGATIIE